MKAQFVYEVMGDIFKPKSEEEIKDALDKNPREALMTFIDINYIKGVKDYFEKHPNETVVPGVIMGTIYNGYLEMTDLLLNYVYVAHSRSYQYQYKYYLQHLDEETKEAMKEILKKHGYNAS